MQINDVSGGQGIFQEIDSLCDSDINSYTANDKTRRCNIALIDLELKALMADGVWRFDDSNYSALPTGIMSAVDGTQTYTFDSTLVMIERIDILLTDGLTWKQLDQMEEIFTERTPTDQAVQTTPSAYFKRGNKFTFDTVPKSTNMTLTSGIKVYFKRIGTLFVSSDTTREPGIVASSHILVAQMAAMPYCKTYKKDRVPQLALDIQAGVKQHIAYYANRGKDERGKMTMRKINPH